MGRLTLENEFLKRGLQNSISQASRNGKSSHGGDASSEYINELKNYGFKTSMTRTGPSHEE